MRLLIMCLIAGLYIADHLVVRNRYLDLMECGHERRDKEHRFDRYWLIFELITLALLTFLACYDF